MGFRLSGLGGLLAGFNSLAGCINGATSTENSNEADPVDRPSGDKQIPIEEQFDFSSSGWVEPKSSGHQHFISLCHGFDTCGHYDYEEERDFLNFGPFAFTHATINCGDLMTPMLNFHSLSASYLEERGLKKEDVKRDDDGECKKTPYDVCLQYSQLPAHSATFGLRKNWSAGSITIDGRLIPNASLELDRFHVACSQGTIDDDEIAINYLMWAAPNGRGALLASGKAYVPIIVQESSWSSCGDFLEEWLCSNQIEPQD